VWVAFHHREDYEKALWMTADGMGDSDTACTIVRVIVTLSGDEIPRDWLERQELLPD